MKPKEYTGEERFERLIKHLLQIEKLTGRPLRKTPRFNLDSCPIENFVAGWDKTNEAFLCVSISGNIWYGNYDHYYDLNDREDSEWWQTLLYNEAIAITERVMRWLREREVK